MHKAKSIIHIYHEGNPMRSSNMPACRYKAIVVMKRIGALDCLHDVTITYYIYIYIYIYREREREREREKQRETLYVTTNCQNIYLHNKITSIYKFVSFFFQNIIASINEHCKKYVYVTAN